MKRIFKKLLSHLPTPVPVGLTEFNDWADSILALSGNYADQDSMKFALASMLIHLPPDAANVPKAVFVRRLRKTAANQVASQVFHDIKVRQTEAALKQQAEDTAQRQTGEVTSDGTQS